MGSMVAARRLLNALVEAEELEIRRVDPLARQLAEVIDAQGRPLSGNELGRWLDEHRLVEDLFADDELLDAAVREHFPEAFAPKAARNADLEAQLLAARADPGGEAHLIYADWLQERGDPLGELVALTASGDTTGAERLRKQRQDYFLGLELGEKLPEHVSLDSCHGLLRGLVASGQWQAESWTRLLGGEAARLLERVEVRFSHADGEETAPVLESIAVHAAASLRCLCSKYGQGLRLPEALWEREALRELELVGGTVHLPQSWPASLERLVLRTRRAPGLLSQPRHVPSTTELRALALGSLDLVQEQPTFETLEALTLYPLEIGTHFHDLGRWLSGVEAPALKALTLHRGSPPLDVLRAILDHPLCRQLEHLGLREVHLGDDELIAFAQVATERGLELTTLDVRENELTAAGLEAAATLAEEVLGDGQASPGTYERMVRRADAARHLADEV